MSWIGRLFGQSSAGKTVLPNIREPHYLVGDIHGCHTLLQRMLDYVQNDAVNQGYVHPKIVLLGDYIDRGPNSASVLQHLYELSIKMPDGLICLKGNHEAMLLKFLDNPTGDARHWLRWGGLDTLASYRVSGATQWASEDSLRQIAMDLRLAIPKGMIPWLSQLPIRYDTGNLVCTHAGLDPTTPVTDQTEDDMLNGPADFLSVPRKDGYWVAHGHYILPQASIKKTRISLDTGAYRTGILSGAVLCKDRTEIFQVT